MCFNILTGLASYSCRHCKMLTAAAWKRKSNVCFGPSPMIYVDGNYDLLLTDPDHTTHEHYCVTHMQKQLISVAASKAKQIQRLAEIEYS